MTTYYIYKIVNNINNKVYIGFTQDPIRRWKQHKTEFKKINRPLYNSMKKHGIENFEFHVLYHSNDRNDTLMNKEPYYIQLYEAYDKGYNCVKGGADTNTDNHRKQSSERMKLHNPMYNADTRNKVSQSLLGHKPKITKERNEKIRQSKLGKNNHNFGNPNAAEPLNKLVTCEHCNRTMNKGNYTRWHGQNCKGKL